jgi:hypothetical protein
MNISCIQYAQGVNGIPFDQTNSESHKGSKVGQTSESDTVHISEKAMELSQKGETNKNSDDISNIVDEKQKIFEERLALLREVGIYKYINIMKTVNQIRRALAKTEHDFPQCKEALEGIEERFAEKLPRSVSEAMSILHKALKGFPEEIRESVWQHLEEEKEKDKISAGTDSLSLGDIPSVAVDPEGWTARIGNRDAVRL